MSLVYVYAIAPGGSAEPKDVRGIEDGPVRAIRDGELVAFVSDVPESEFGETPLNAHLADMEWLTPRAVRHQEVNAALAAVCDPLVPLSFGAQDGNGSGYLGLGRLNADGAVDRAFAKNGKAMYPFAFEVLDAGARQRRPDRR